MGTRTAYFQCVGGASGDMVLGALVDAGVPIAELDRALRRLQATGWTLFATTERRGGVTGASVRVELDDEGRRTRQPPELLELVGRGDLPARVVEQASRIIRRLAEAEAAAHGVTPDRVHLHELGTLDTLVDVVGAVWGLDHLGVERVCSSPLPSGSGVVRSLHGALPVPAPATAHLMASAGAPVVPPPAGALHAGEMVTPTGAAILTTLASFEQPAMKLERVGYGLGSREAEAYPNVLGLWIGEDLSASHTADLALIETNIDDMSAEVLAYVHERLMEAGARDVWFTPIQMKKGRPGTMLSALVTPELEPQAVALVLRETSTLGVRVRRVGRYEAARETVEVETSLGRVQVKLKRLAGAVVGVSPEYEWCRRIALATHQPLQDVMLRVQREAERLLGG